MGADIHMRVEIKDFHNNGTFDWMDGDVYFKRRNYKTDNEYSDEYVMIPFYEDRSYMLFSILAGVRNEYDIEPISMPKGIPSDCCDSVKTDIDSWRNDGHSCSYLTLKEIKEYYKTHETISVTVFITKEDAEEFDNNGTHPNWWTTHNDEYFCEKRTMKLDSPLYELIIKPLEKRSGELCGGYYREEKDDDIRIVFWFDN